MSARWFDLFGIVTLIVLLLRGSVTDMCQEEIRTRLGQIPCALLRLVALRLPKRSREETIDEWRAELDYILRDTEGLPITRLLRGMHYSASLIRILVPSDVIADLIARYTPQRLSRPRSVKTIVRPARISWLSSYLRQASVLDCLAALASGQLAFWVRLDGTGQPARSYLVLSLCLALIWLAAVSIAGGYDARVLGVGADEFRRLLNAGVGTTAAVAIFAYSTKVGFATGFVEVALPCVTFLDMIARYGLRKRLHWLRRFGSCMRRIVLVGPPEVVAELIVMLRTDTYHGLMAVGACLTGPPGREMIAGVPVLGGLQDITDAIAAVGADTLAVLACPEMAGERLRRLAWDLEKTSTDLCIAPAMLDVAGPLTTIRPVTGLPLLHMDHLEFTGVRPIVKEAFDKLAALAALILAAPLLALLALIIRLEDGGPVLFRQTRVGKDGRPFEALKFRTMVPDAESRTADLAGQNQQPGPLFRDDPRITRGGSWLRRWSLDELPQLLNVIAGDMSLVGPRPALPEEAAMYGDHVRRRLAVKPGMTGLWQVNGRADLSWDESVRLDLRYVENWSFMLDLQIMWKSGAAVIRGSGAY